MEDDPWGQTYAPGQPAPGMPQRRCVNCGRAIEPSYAVCPFCGHDYRVALALAPPSTPRSSKPVAAGVLMVIAGLLAIAMGATLMVIDAPMFDEIGYDPWEELGMTVEEIMDIFVVCGSFQIVAGIIAVVGSVFTLTRRYFPLAVLGGIFAILGMGFVIGAILGLASLILVALSRSEF